MDSSAGGFLSAVQLCMSLLNLPKKMETENASGIEEEKVSNFKVRVGKMICKRRQIPILN